MSATPSVLTREAGTSTAPIKPGRKRPSLAHILIILAAVLAFAFNYLALQARNSLVMVAVANETLSSGSILDSSAVGMVAVPSDLSGLDGLIGEATLDEVDGYVVGISISVGDLIPRAALTEPASHDGLRLMSLPVDRDRAAGGSIGPGDRVDVISMVEGAPGLVATDLEVVQVADTTQGALSAGSTYYLVVALDTDEALALAGALESGVVNVIRSTGADPVDGAAG